MIRTCPRTCPDCGEPVIVTREDVDRDPDSEERAYFAACSDCGWLEEIEEASDD